MTTNNIMLGWRREIIITEDDIRENVKRELEDLVFPDEDARIEFIDDCVACVIDNYEQYEIYMPDYQVLVLDMAKLYGYLTI